MPTTTNSKLPYPATTDPANVPGDLQNLAGALDEIAYAQFTAPVSITATTEGTAATVVTASAVTFDGATPVVIWFFAPYVATPSANGGAVSVILYDGASSIGLIGFVQNTPTTNPIIVPVMGVRHLTPTAGAHTYSIRAYVNSGTGSIGAGAGGSTLTVPAFVRITRA